MISRRRYFMAVPALLCATAGAMFAQKPAPDYVAVKLDPYIATSDLWRTDGGFQSTIRLKNMLAVTAIDVNVTLYMADGTPYALPPVHLAKSSVATVSVNAAMASAPPSLAGHISQSGSATLEYRYDWAGAVLGSVSILDTVRSLQFESRFVIPEPMKPGMAGETQDASGSMAENRIQGMWWKYSATSSVFLSVANPTNDNVEADVAVLDERQRLLGTRHFSLGPHASTLSLLDNLIGVNPAKLVGALDITYGGEPGSVLFSGGLEDDKAGYSAALLLSMEKMPMAGTSTPPASSCTVAAAGLMLGAPDPMEGFPASVRFLPFGFARNATSGPLTLTGLVNYMDASGPHSAALPAVSLGAGEVRDLKLNQVLHLPFRDGMANLSYTYNAPCGSLLLSTGSVDAKGSYVFEVNPQAVGKSGGRVSQYWQVGGGTDTMYSVWNPTPRTEDLMVTIHFEPGGVYHYPLHLAANASAMISMLDLLLKGTPDAQGHVIPVDTRMGSLKIAGTDPDVRDMPTFVVSAGIYNPVAATCCTPYWTCYGSTGSQVVLASFTIPMNSTQNESFYLTQGDGTQLDYTSYATWSSGDTSVLTVGSGGIVTAEGPGLTTFYSMVSSVPIYVAQFCVGNCPVGNEGAGGPGTVVSLACAPSSVNWNTSVTCTVSGVSASQVTNWRFSGNGVGVAGPSGTLTWEGPLVVSGTGTITATVAQQDVSTTVTVSARQNLPSVTVPQATRVANGYSVNSITLDTLVSPPTTAEGTFGESAYARGFALATLSPLNGPNQGIHFVNTLTDSSVYPWELNPGVTTSSDAFYQHQGNCFATISQIVAAVQAHEIGTPGPSHYTEVQSELTTNNPGVVATNAIGPDDGSVTAPVQAAYDAAYAAGKVEPPTNLPSNINYYPYSSCP